jgi:hypothetical protein
VVGAGHVPAADSWRKHQWGNSDPLDDKLVAGLTNITAIAMKD